LASAGGEQCVVRPGVVVGQPNTECGNGLSGQGRGAVFAALAGAPAVRAGAEVDVGAT